MRKNLPSRQGSLKTWTKPVVWMLENRVAASRACGTLCSASQLLSSLSSECSTASNLEELLGHRVTLGQHMLILDADVDRCTSEHLLELREMVHWQVWHWLQMRALPTNQDLEASGSRSQCSTGEPICLKALGDHLLILQ